MKDHMSRQEMKKEARLKTEGMKGVKREEMIQKKKEEII